MLVPPLLLAIVLVAAGTVDPEQLRHVLPSLAAWKLVALGYVAFSCGQAAFPSSGDRIGILGGVALTGVVAAAIAVILVAGGRAELTAIVRDLCLLLAVPAAASALSLVLLGALARVRRGY